MNSSPRDPLILTLNGLVDTVEHPQMNIKAGNLRLTVHDKRVQISGLSVELHGETDGQSILMKGTASPEQLSLWQPALTELIKLGLPGDHQLDIYEEDGRLLKRLQVNASSQH